MPCLAAWSYKTHAPLRTLTGTATPLTFYRAGRFLLAPGATREAVISPSGMHGGMDRGASAALQTSGEPLRWFQVSLIQLLLIIQLRWVLTDSITC